MQVHHMIKRLNELGSELITLHGLTEYFDIHLKVTGREHLRLDDNLDGLWNALREWRSAGRFDILTSSLFPFDQKISLTQWITDLIRIRHEKSGRPRELFGESLSSLMPPTDLGNIQIWSHRLPVFSGHVQDPGYYYWGDLFSELDYWRKEIDIGLETVEWVASSTAVSFVMKWRGLFQSIEVLDVKGTGDTFWSIIFQSGNPAYLSVVSTTYLLDAQLTAQLGGNKLVPVELRDDQLTMILEIHRADTVSSTSFPSSPIAESVLEQLGRYLVDQSLPGYIKTSERLESILSKEIDRVEPQMRDDGDEFWLDQLREILEQLQTIREFLASNW